MGETLTGFKEIFHRRVVQSWDRGWFSEGQGEALSDSLEPCSQPCSEQELGLRPPEVLPTSLFWAAASVLQFLPAKQPAESGVRLV